MQTNQDEIWDVFNWVETISQIYGYSTWKLRFYCEVKKTPHVATLIAHISLATVEKPK